MKSLLIICVGTTANADKIKVMAESHGYTVTGITWDTGKMPVEKVIVEVRKHTAIAINWYRETTGPTARVCKYAVASGRKVLNTTTGKWINGFDLYPVKKKEKKEVVK